MLVGVVVLLTVVELAELVVAAAVVMGVLVEDLLQVLLIEEAVEEVDRKQLVQLEDQE
jgi:hypothetical protein